MTELIAQIHGFDYDIRVKLEGVGWDYVELDEERVKISLPEGYSTEDVGQGFIDVLNPQGLAVASFSDGKMLFFRLEDEGPGVEFVAAMIELLQAEYRDMFSDSTANDELIP